MDTARGWTSKLLQRDPQKEPYKGRFFSFSLDDEIIIQTRIAWMLLEMKHMSDAVAFKEPKRDHESNYMQGDIITISFAHIVLESKVPALIY